MYAPQARASQLIFVLGAQQQFLFDAAPCFPEHPPGVLAELREGHARITLRLHPGNGSQDVIHVVGEALQQDARPLVEHHD